MIERKQRIPMRDLAQLSGEEADTAAKNRVGGRDLNLFRVMMNHPDLTRRWTVSPPTSGPISIWRPGSFPVFRTLPTPMMKSEDSTMRRPFSGPSNRCPLRTVLTK